MTASAGSGNSSPATRRFPLHPRLGRPEHLVAWLDGGFGEPVRDAWPVDGDFALGVWAAGIRTAHPEAVTAAVFPCHGGEDASGHPSVDGEADGDWLSTSRDVARIAATGDGRSFMGDTTPTSLRSLRQWVIGLLGRLDYPVDDAALVVSELATNVERHGRSWLIVDLFERDLDLLVAVTDPSPERLPELYQVGVEEPSGRGLLVVASVAQRWGVVIRPVSKTVWATIRRTP